MLAPRKPKSPPLNALRAFEASARLGGFKAAAIELSVTPGAVAQHIKTLEAWVGAALFERMSQGVKLTDLGLTVSDDFSLAFDQLGEAVNRLRAAAGSQQIRIAVLPSIAQLWLSPRLPAVRQLSPQTRISITALDSAPNLLREPYDLSLFFIEGELPPHSVEICQDFIFPVCAPALAEGLHSPEDLAGSTFLHDTHWSADWPRWLAAAVPGLKLDYRGPSLSLYSLALQEAQNGAGVIMGHEPLVRDSLANGSLVAPFKPVVEIPQRLVISTPYPARHGSMIRTLIETLVES